MPRPNPVHLPMQRPIGFVLGGGGALGAVQVGMLRALLEHDIVPDLVVGTSIGAFNGAVLAANPARAVDILTKFWNSWSRSDALHLRGVKPLLHWRRTHQSLYPNDGVTRGIRSVLQNYPLIEDLALPFGAVAVDVRRGLPELLCRGPLESALLASAAIPGIFPPVERNGILYYDGGLGDNVPIRDAVKMGARSLVVLDTTNPVADLEQPMTLSTIASYVTEVYSRQSVLRHLEDFEHLQTLYPPSAATGTMSPLDTSHTKELMHQSYRNATEYLDRVLLTA